MAKNRDPLETNVRRTVAFDILQRSFNSWGGKAKRRRDNIAGDIAEALGKNEVPDGVVARIEERIETEKARTIRQAIEVFKSQHPDYGAKLEAMITEEREKANRYTVIAVAESYRLTQTDYRRVMIDLGMTSEEADKFYEPLMDVCKRLDKADFGEERSILL